MTTHHWQAEFGETAYRILEEGDEVASFSPSEDHFKTVMHIVTCHNSCLNMALKQAAQRRVQA